MQMANICNTTGQSNNNECIIHFLQMYSIYSRPEIKI